MDTLFCECGHPVDVAPIHGERGSVIFFDGDEENGIGEQTTSCPTCGRRLDLDRLFREPPRNSPAEPPR